jgi:ribonuclease inhibitor
MMEYGQVRSANNNEPGWSRTKTMERVFYIDLAGISTKEEFHKLLAEELPFPDYYGGNLDALYDVLTDDGEGWNVIFYNVTKASELADYLKKARKMAKRAMMETQDLKIRFFD